MKITRKQIEEWNEKCGNGFKVNERQAIMWGQKRLYKYINSSAKETKLAKESWEPFKQDFLTSALISNPS